MMPSTGLTALAGAALVVAFGSAAIILHDILRRGHRQQMAVMKWVWPVTALYLGPLAIWAYRRFGRPSSPVWRIRTGLDEPPDKPGWVATSIGVSHCGAGCVYWFGMQIAMIIGFGTAWPVNRWLIRRGVKEAM
jgi:hypothetical protein